MRIQIRACCTIRFALNKPKEKLGLQHPVNFIYLRNPQWICTAAPVPLFLFGIQILQYSQNLKEPLKMVRNGNGSNFSTKKYSLWISITHPLTMQIVFKETLWKAATTFLHMKSSQSSTTQFSVCHFPKTVMTFTIFLIVNVFGHRIYKEWP